jgi:acetyl-CoA carboxylase carboxyl transferase subunit alpha
MLQFSYYSVISPEGCAGILWKGANPANCEKAARALKFTGRDLLGFGVVDEVLPEPLGAAHRDHRAMAGVLKSMIVKNLKSLSALPVEELLTRRYQKFRRIGVFEETLSGDADPQIDGHAN